MADDDVVAYSPLMSAQHTPASHIAPVSCKRAASGDREVGGSSAALTSKQRLQGFEAAKEDPDWTTGPNGGPGSREIRPFPATSG